jgi:NitT/TauT family transport system permease protein
MSWVRIPSLAPPFQRVRRAFRIRGIALRAGSILLLILFWWAAARLMHDHNVLPGPGVILQTILKDLGTPGPEGRSAYFDIGITLARIFIAFFAAMLAGTGLGLAMGLSRICERSLLAVIPLMLTMPTIPMVFLAVLWFAFSEAGGLVAVMAVVTPYVTVNVFEGAKAMDKSLVDMAVAFKARRSLLVRRVFLHLR